MVIFDGPGIHLRHVVFIDLSIKEERSEVDHCFTQSAAF